MSAVYPFPLGVVIFTSPLSSLLSCFSRCSFVVRALANAHFGALGTGSTTLNQGTGLYGVTNRDAMSPQNCGVVKAVTPQNWGVIKSVVS